MRKLLIIIISTLFLFTACKNKNKVYELNDVLSDPVNTGKVKLKSTEQYIAILYANLFQKALSANKLVEITECIQSIGDKDIAHEVVISNFLNDPEIIIPSRIDMLTDVNYFLEETYHRFYVRDITESEKMYWNNLIIANDSINPEMIYYAFALSDEYQYY